MSNTQQFWGILAAVVTVLGAIITTKITSRSSERAAREPARLQMEADAFEHAATYWKSTIASLETDVQKLNLKVDALVARGEASEKREQQLTERVRILEQVLIDNHIEVPPWHVVI